MTARPTRLHWVSPLPPQQTDIAHYTRRILPALAERAEIVLWTDTPGWDPELEDFAEVRLFDPDAPTALDLRGGEAAASHADAVFHHIGNSWVFHAGIVKLARRVPGVVVLHDLAIQEFLRDLVNNALLDGALYRDAMARHHGSAGASAAEAILAGGPTPEQLERMPMFQFALEGAAAALCHTPSGFEQVAATELLPVYHADLPFLPGEEVKAERAADGPLRLVQFGHIGPNRRLEPILEALSSVRERLDFRFDIFGKVWDEAYILGRADDLGIAERLHLRGFAPEPELDAAVRRAHLVFNLRFPTMGEASGSQLRIWNSAAASVVTDLGWYATIPDDTAFKIPLDGEVAALAETLTRIDSDRTLCQAMGRAGRARLLSHHTPERYADAILDIARRSERDARSAQLLSAAAAAMQRAGPAARQLYAERIARVCEER